MREDLRPTTPARIASPHRRHLLLLAALLALAVPGQMAGQVDGPPDDDLRLALKIVSAEVQRLPETMSLIASGRAMEVDEALLLKTAVSRRSLDRFPPARQPMMSLGRHVYPIFRQEPSNWNLREERPIDPSRPVGEVQFLYFLIPDWRELPDSAVPILAAGGADRRRSATAAPPPPDPLLDDLAGSRVFRREMIIDRSP